MIDININEKNLLKQLKENLDELMKQKSVIDEKVHSLKQNQETLSKQIGFKEKYFSWIFGGRHLFSNLKLINKLLEENEKRLAEISPIVQDLTQKYKQELFKILNQKDKEFNIMNTSGIYLLNIRKSIIQINSNKAEAIQDLKKNIIENYSKLKTFLHDYEKNGIPIEIGKIGGFKDIRNFVIKHIEFINLLSANSPQTINNYINLSNSILKDIEQLNIMIYGYTQNTIICIENQLQ